MKRKGILILTAAVLLLALVLVACGGGDDTGRGEEHVILPQTQVDVPENDVPAVDPALLQAAEDIAAGFGELDGSAITWQVLTVDEGGSRALLLSDSCLAVRPFLKDDSGATTWYMSDVRSWLNIDVLQDCFTDAEWELILQVGNVNPANSETGVKGDDTFDRLFLLSEQEVERYLGDENRRIAVYRGETVQWWLRTPGDDTSSYMLVNEAGELLHDGAHCAGSYGVRPAVWVDLEPRTGDPYEKWSSVAGYWGTADGKFFLFDMEDSHSAVFMEGIYDTSAAREGRVIQFTSTEEGFVALVQYSATEATEMDDAMPEVTVTVTADLSDREQDGHIRIRVGEGEWLQCRYLADDAEEAYDVYHTN